MTHPNSFGARATLTVGPRQYAYFRLAAVEGVSEGRLATLPYSLKVLLENLLRGEDGAFVKKADIEALARWDVTVAAEQEVAYRPARVLLQDFTGVPCVVDLAAMRDAITQLGGDPQRINPLQPVDLVIDHSVQADEYGTPEAFLQNVSFEYERNQERYRFLRWGQSAFENFGVVPPGVGICHQVNLEYLARVVFTKEADGETLAYPDSLVGTDSHTTMVNGLGVFGWGVGGIEAEAAMLGQPLSMLVPEVIGFKLTGKLPVGATATDLVLTVTEMLRKKKVVGKFVEFYGAGLSNLSLADRATIANMAPEYGATMGFFPVDEETLKYLRLTGRSEEQIALVEAYTREQGLFRTDASPDPVYTDSLELELGTVEPSLAGPRRPQDRIPLRESKPTFQAQLDETLAKIGTPSAKAELFNATKVSAEPQLSPAVVATAVEEQEPEGVEVEYNGARFTLRHGAVVLAAITSCTNTSNPSVMLGAGLLARNAVRKGLRAKPWVKSTLSPGSRVVTDYYEKADVLKDLEALGFYLAGYGCMTCIGNSGPLPEPIQAGRREGEARGERGALGEPQLRGARQPAHALQLPGEPDARRGLRARRPHGHRPGARAARRRRRRAGVPARHLAVAAGDRGHDPLEREGRDVHAAVRHGHRGRRGVARARRADGRHLRVGPAEHLRRQPAVLRRDDDGAAGGEAGGRRARARHVRRLDHHRPHLAGGQHRRREPGRKVADRPRRQDARVQLVRRPPRAPRGDDARHLRQHPPAQRARAGTEGGFTTMQPGGDPTPIYDAAMRYQEQGTPLVIVAGKEYGTGSSRDWAAKGTVLLGVRAVIAESFERIHRSNLVGMGVLPLEFANGETRQSLGLTGFETIDIEGMDETLRPRARLRVRATAADGSTRTFEAVARIDTPEELSYYRHGGILPYVLRSLVGRAVA
jgi:aconitate hydratase